MNKEKLEKFCGDVGLKPEAKIAIKDGHVLIADGLVSPAGKASLVRRGAFDIGEFPDGVYMTIWFWEDGDKYPVSGRPLFFDKNHDPHYDTPTKKDGRIQRCFDDAIETFKLMEKVHGTV